MAPIKTIVVGKHEKEVLDFLEKVRVAGKVRVQTDSDIYLLSLIVPSKKGHRSFLEGGTLED